MEIVCPTHISGWHGAKASERYGDVAQRQMAVLDRTRLIGKLVKKVFPFGNTFLMILFVALLFLSPDLRLLGRFGDKELCEMIIFNSKEI